MSEQLNASPQNAPGFVSNAWYFVAGSKDLKPGGQIRQILFGQPILLGRKSDGDLFALRDICPHRLAPLSSGRQVMENGETAIACPYHGWRFSTETGSCLRIPSQTEEQSLPLDGIGVGTYKIRESNGLVYLLWPGSEPETKAIQPPELGALPASPGLILTADFDSHIDHTTAGLMDPAHVGFVHNKWWWRPERTGLRRKEKAFEPRDFGWSISRHAPSDNSVAYKILGKDVTTEIHYQLPGYRWEIIESRNRRIVSLSCLVPVTEHKTRMTQVTWWENVMMATLLKPILKRFGREFLRQDQEIVGLQATNLPFEQRMLWINDTDQQAKWYQALKREWLACQAETRDFRNPIEPTVLRWMS
ncbi:MAG: aromatic ring-hydroxylating dioxygenase subunit alpha [Pseudomonadota bacterium]